MKNQIDDGKKFWKSQRLLVISPHPDDEVFGCGGTMAKAKALGAEVYLMIVSVGNLKFYEKRNVVKSSTRVVEVEKVSKMIGLDGYEIIYEDEYKHLRLDSIPRRDLIAKIERDAKLALDKICPTVVAIPAPSYNQDHEAVYEACFTALRIHAGGFKSTPDTVLVYDSPTLYWNHPGKCFQPNFYVDISKYQEIKKKLVKIYQSQQRDSKDPCSLKNIEELMHVRGREVGREACEAYMLCRHVV